MGAGDGDCGVVWCCAHVGGRHGGGLSSLAFTESMGSMSNEHPWDICMGIDLNHKVASAPKVFTCEKRWP